MCESRVILRSGGAEEVIAEEAAAVRRDGKKVTVVRLAGDDLVVEAEIAEVDFVGHCLVLVRE